MPEKPVPLRLLPPSWVQQLPRLRVQPLPKGEAACLHSSGALGATPGAPLFLWNACFDGMPPWAMCWRRLCCCMTGAFLPVVGDVVQR